MGDRNTVLNLNNALFDVNGNHRDRLDGSQIDTQTAKISRITVSAAKTLAWPVNTIP
jgi:hypothetical protein